MAKRAVPLALAALLTPEAVRDRAERLYALAERNRLPHFRLHPERIEDAVEAVLAEVHANYPGLDIPLHSRWRHLERDGASLFRPDGLRGAALARARVELATVSVLLDAGAGPGWRYRDAATGLVLGRSEGLARASLRMFEAGGFSARAARAPLRADAERLKTIRAADLAAHFQAGDGNPLVGLEGRAKLLNALGGAIPPGQDRLGWLYDVLAAAGPVLPARRILVTLLAAFNRIWPSGLVVDGVALGDVGRHGALGSGGPGDDLVPFHKLSQWLAYSLVEPLAEAGQTITDLDALTGLAEYRNGGLFVDTGVLELRDPGLLERPLGAGEEAVVEWRALTVALLDRVAAAVRRHLGRTAEDLPLAAVLQGGTWSAGRRLAAGRGGRPPFEVVSDGTVF